jgi:L-glutamine-phosphate cytidylyltransferase
MELVILAAGTGSRLWPLTKHVPKSLLDLGDGRCLLERQIESATACQVIDQCTVVVGYRAAQVEDRIRHLKERIAIGTIFNPVYRTTNNLLSLWFALPRLRERDFVVSNGDNLYKRDVLPLVTSVGEGIWLTIDRKPAYDEDDMKVTLAADGTVQHVAKTIAPAETDAESVGLVVVRGERYRRVFTNMLDAMVREESGLTVFWLEIFNALARNGQLIRTVEIPHASWIEVDFHPDVEKLRHSILARVDWND